MKQDRFKSKAMWLAVTAQAIHLLMMMDIIPKSDVETINMAIIACLNILTLFGVLNNPTDKTSF